MFRVLQALSAPELNGKQVRDMFMLQVLCCPRNGQQDEGCAT
jgi:hypothetical protein